MVEFLQQCDGNVVMIVLKSGGMVEVHFVVKYYIISLL